MSLEAIRGNVIVDPLYDPSKVETGLSPGAPGLYMPDSAKNPMSQQGIVIAVGPKQKVIEVGQHILYHPFIQFPFKVGGHEYLKVETRHIVGFLDSDGRLCPLPWDIVVHPDFRSAGRPVQSGLLWLPKQVFDVDIPCTGTAVSVGSRVTSVRPGQRILFPPEGGNEIGLRKVWYTIREGDVLAILEGTVSVVVKVTPPNWNHNERI